VPWELSFLKPGPPAEIDAAFEALARRADALFIQADGFFASRRVQIATLAARERMPASYVSREMVEAGLLMGYGTNIADMFRQVGVYTGSILLGAKPADLPVIQATKFEFIINLQTAKSLGGPDRIRGTDRSGRRRPGRKLGSAGRQHHRVLRVRIRPERQMARAAQTSCATREPGGGSSRFPHTGRDRPVGCNPRRRAVVRSGIDAPRRARPRRD